MWWSAAGLLLASLVCACGGSEDPAGAGAASGSAGKGFAGSAGTASGGNAGASPGGSGGASAGSATGGSGGGGGLPSVSCAGTFGPPSVVLEAAANHELGSLSLGPGELELIYATADATATPPLPTYRRSVRQSTSVPFPQGEPLPELDAACDPGFDRSGDLTLDGLRYYFACHSPELQGLQPLRMARRASLDAPFVLDQSTYGNVYRGATIGPDELELITSPAAFSGYPNVRHERASLVAAFGPPLELSGLSLNTPELSADGRFLFASSQPDGSNAMHIVTAARASDGVQFGPPVPVVSVDEAAVVGSAAISADCRSLYYVHVELSGPVYRVLVVTR